MTTPSPLGDVFQQSAGPPSSFLRRLLDDIRCSGDPDSAAFDPTTTGTRRQAQNTYASTHQPSSACVNGMVIAKEARHKLRAADIACSSMLRRQGTDGTASVSSSSPDSLACQRSEPVPTTSCDEACDRDDVERPSVLMEDAPLDCFTSPNIKPRAPNLRRPILDHLLIPATRPHANQVDEKPKEEGAISPLMFCDADSDVSLTPSTSDPPTSATTVGSPSGANHSRPTGNGSGSPGKRRRSPHTRPKMFSKKLRARTEPVHSAAITSTTADRSPLYMPGIGDNHCIIRNKSFIERVPTLPPASNSSGLQTLPEVSSFRPEISDMQGLSPSVPKTPTRSSLATRSASMPNHYPYPDAETPPFARPLLLMDDEMPIYKNVHGDAWREHALCLWCFRLKGKFRRILTYGCEACGEEEKLESHHWEGD